MGASRDSLYGCTLPSRYFWLQPLSHFPGLGDPGQSQACWLNAGARLFHDKEIPEFRPIVVRLTLFLTIGIVKMKGLT